jgi:hypothetical protein
VPLLVPSGDQPPTKTPTSGPTIRWGQLTIGLAIFSAACLGTLVVVVSIKEVDVLSTVALALAVLAFAAQLIVSLAQSQAAAQQLAEVERVNSETKAALAEIRATSHSLLSTQTSQFDKVLGVALRSVVPEALAEAAGEPGNGNKPIDAEDLVNRIVSSLPSAIESAQRTSQPPVHSTRTLVDRMVESLDTLSAHPDGILFRGRSPGSPSGPIGLAVRLGYADDAVQGDDGKMRLSITPAGRKFLDAVRRTVPGAAGYEDGV